MTDWYLLCQQSFTKLTAELKVGAYIISVPVYLALRWRRDQRQPAAVGAEEHHHHLSLLWREWHLSPRQFHQLPWAALHQHQHPDEPGQHVPPQQGPVSTRAQGRKCFSIGGTFCFSGAVEGADDNTEICCNILYTAAYFSSRPTSQHQTWNRQSFIKHKLKKKRNIPYY